MQAAVAVLGSLAVFGGLLSVGAGMAGWRALRRIQETGVAVWALVFPAPTSPEDARSAYRPFLRYTTEDGLPLEVFSPMAPSKTQPLVEGRPILIRHDPADPTQIVVHGMRACADLVFIALGTVAAAGATAFMIFTP
jgi:hypothetical protein